MAMTDSEQKGAINMRAKIAFGCHLNCKVRAQKETLSEGQVEYVLKGEAKMFFSYPIKILVE